MRTIERQQAAAWIGALMSVAVVDGGPTSEQRRILDALQTGYFGLEAPSPIDPMEPELVVQTITDPDERHRLIQMMIVLELARHPSSPATATAVERYARWAEVDEPMLIVARDAVDGAREFVNADFKRFYEPESAPPEFANVDPATIPDRLRHLSECEPGTLGRTFIEFYDRYGLDLPGTVDSPPEDPTGDFTNIMVKHDFSHVLAGYEPNNGVEELALNMMLVSASDGGHHHFCNLMASLSLHETGIFESSQETPKQASLDRPGAPEVFAEAMRRGAECEVDFWDIDHLAVANQPLEEVRDELGIPPRVVPQAPRQ
jgi:hypothetical protein